jgi:hypothetical protein
MLFLCAQSVSIGFHLNGLSTARRSAKEMQEILREAPMIERDLIKIEKVGILVGWPSEGINYTVIIVFKRND